MKNTRIEYNCDESLQMTGISSGAALLSSASNCQEENYLLQQEINKLEDLLSNARAERDEILIRYNALSDRVTFFPTKLQASIYF